jgi:hypothetical protein
VKLFTPPPHAVLPSLKSEAIPCSAWGIFITVAHQLLSLILLPAFLAIYFIYLLAWISYLAVTSLYQ